MDLFHRMKTGLVALRSRPTLPLVTALMLVTILMWADLSTAVILPIYALATLGLVIPRWGADPRLWLLLTALLAISVAVNWHPLDNHQFLFVYIALLLFLVHHVEQEPRQITVLAEGSRLLLGAVMTLAVVWKLLTPDYLDGRFFHFTILVHGALQTIPTAAGDLAAHGAAANQDHLQWLHHSYLSTDLATAIELEGTPTTAFLAQILTWWTIGIEALIALLFLWPSRFGGQKAPIFYGRHLALFLFLLTTYPLAPILGFGWALVILALGDCARRHTLLRPIYVTTAFVLLLAGYFSI